MIEDPIQIIAPVVSLIVAYVFFYEGLIYNIGKNGVFWSTFRTILPYIDDEAREVGFYTNTEVSKNEFVGVLHTDRSEAVNIFYNKGFIDAPLAAHKEDWAGRREIASLGHYGYHGDEIESWGDLKRFVMMSMVIKKQLHVTLFENEDEIIIASHHEDSPYNLMRAYKHLRTKNYDAERGVQMIREKLKDVELFELTSVE